MLKIDNLHVSVGEKEILKGLNLQVEAGQVVAIMGPNGTGKSTLGNTLVGRDGYEITEGTVTLDGADLLDMEPNERATNGLFLAFQYPTEVPGIKMNRFLSETYNSQRRQRGEDELNAAEFLRYMRGVMKEYNIPQEFANREVNVGFSGGEKKRNEIFQMAIHQPKLCVLDEIDSGLDIDALRYVSEGINKLRSPDRSFILITHYQRLLDYVKPDVVHIMNGGKIVKSGGPELALELEEKGYEGV